MKNKKLLSYSNYLQLDKILSGQELMSAKRGVPAHDDRDYLFAEKYKLPVIQVVKQYDKKIKTE